MRPALPTASATPATTSTRGLKRYERMQQPFGSALVEVNREEGAYLSAQIKPKAERTAAELNRDIGAVLHAHIARSEQVGDIVAAHGLAALAGHDTPVRV